MVTCREFSCKLSGTDFFFVLCARHIDHISFHFFAELKRFPSFFIYHTHDDFDIADPSSTQDTCHHMNFVYGHFEKGCQIKCTRQPRKELWVVLSLLFFKEIWKNVTGGHGRMCASAKGKQQKWIQQLQCQGQCIEHIPYYLSGLSRALFSDSLSRNSCMAEYLVTSPS